MSTDELIQEDVREAMSFEKVPSGQPTAPKAPKAPRVRRVSGVAARLRYKRDVAVRFGNAIEFALQLLDIGMKGKPLQRSIKLQYGISTEAARAAVRAARAERRSPRRRR